MRALVVGEVSDLRGKQRIAGAICFRRWMNGEVAGITFICPCGCGEESYLPVNGSGRPGHSWDWDRELEYPTLSPSIHNTGMPCRWHGWLRRGEWVAC
ncbi:DUF6527 family protein [Paracoccus sp. APAP_BH8]|uniref:DUF6527 family protein n=1 Tax=Paracoccus sp. APAP_BH8 TaxID=3110237 RepID=UPI002FD7CF40